jgi:glycosyltransferase involved in cell wall biosynthesis
MPDQTDQVIFYSAMIKGLVSVIIPVYNGEKYIRETLQSVINQTYKKFEIILVDDGSTDATLEQVRNFDTKERVVRIISQERGGVAQARNTGISHSQGEFIAPLDADDIWYPEKLSNQIKVMNDKGPRTGLVYSWTVRIDANSKLLGLCSTSSFEGPVFGSLLTGNFISSASVPLIRRSCLERVGGYSTDFYSAQAQGCEDYDLHLRISENYYFGVVKKILTGYRWHSKSMSKNHLTMYKSYNLTMKRLEMRHPNIPNSFIKLSLALEMFYLESICMHCGDYYKSLYYLIISIKKYPPLINSRFFMGVIKFRILMILRKIRKSKEDFLFLHSKKYVNSKSYSFEQIKKMSEDYKIEKEGTLNYFKSIMRSDVNLKIYRYI